MSEEDRQEYVIGLVGQINHVLAGERADEACTALTLAVACQIVITDKGSVSDRVAQVRNFAKQVESLVRRADIVEWIRASTTYMTGSERKQ